VKNGFEIVKIEEFSGSKAVFYGICIDGDSLTTFERFLDEFDSLYPSEIENILTKIETMSTKTGARIEYFKLKEGKPGDGVCALYDEDDKGKKKLRLYCIRYDNTIVIIGGGGEKPKGMKSLQESPRLKKENQIMRDISEMITKRMNNGIELTESGFTGNLKFSKDQF
jgi:hypothetical protein